MRRVPTLPHEPAPTPGGERSVDLQADDTFVVLQGVEHRPSSPDGASILVLDRVGTLTTGDYAGVIPEHIVSTAEGRALS